MTTFPSVGRLLMMEILSGALIKLGHRSSQISPDIWFFITFNILVIRVPKKMKFLYFQVIYDMMLQVFKEN